MSSIAAWSLSSTILVCLIVAIATDFADRIIPNRLVLVVLGCAMGLRLLSGFCPLATSLLAASAVLLVLGSLAAYDLLGWGDVKLIVAVTFAVPASQVIALLLAITLAGGVLSCVYLVAGRVLRRGRAGRDATHHPGLLRRFADREGARILAREPMPYAVAVLGGVAYGLAAG